MEYLYACHFSNGAIKVGRSIDPASRIATHVERVACVGIELVEHQALPCIALSVSAERALLDKCRTAAGRTLATEWFDGLSFIDVCEWMHELCIADSIPAPIGANAAATKVIEALGDTAEVARMFEVRMPSVSDWKRTGIPRARMLYIRAVRPDVLEGIDVEAATSGEAASSEAA